jgi:hypothetical protein
MKIIILLFAAVIFLGLLINDAYRVSGSFQTRTQATAHQTIGNQLQPHLFSDEHGAGIVGLERKVIWPVNLLKPKQ